MVICFSNNAKLTPVPELVCPKDRNTSSWFLQSRFIAARFTVRSVICFEFIFSHVARDKVLVAAHPRPLLSLPRMGGSVLPPCFLEDFVQNECSSLNDDGT